jgi:outer membrane protein assembly factor BamB
LDTIMTFSVSNHNPPLAVLFRCRLALKALSALLAVGLAATAAAQDWPVARGNAPMTGNSPTKLNFPLELVWTFAAGDKTKREGVIAESVVQGGRVYVGSQSGRFFCLDLVSGKELWKVEKKGAFEGNAGFAGDLVIAGCVDGFVYAWNKTDGKEAWKFETDGEVHAGVNIWTGPDGKLRALVGSYDNKLYCLDAATGAKLWEYETANYVNGAAAIFDGKTAFGGCDGTLYILDMEKGTEVKKIEIGAYIGNNIAVDKGVAYITHYGNKVVAYALSDGAKLWEYGDRDFPYYAAAAVTDGWVVAAGRDKRVRGLERQKGEEKWVFRTRGDVDSSPLICAASTVLFGSNDGFFYAANLSTGEETWRYEVGAPVKTAPAVAGDFVLIGADDGNIYCFKNGKAAESK